MNNQANKYPVENGLLEMPEEKLRCRFEFYNDNKGANHYCLLGKENELLFKSENFPSLKECMQRLEILKMSDVAAMKQKIKVTRDHRCIFVLRLGGVTFGISEPFSEVHECRKAITRALFTLLSITQKKHLAIVSNC